MSSLEKSIEWKKLRIDGLIKFFLNDLPRLQMPVPEPELAAIMAVQKTILDLEGKYSFLGHSGDGDVNPLFLMGDYIRKPTPLRIGTKNKPSTLAYSGGKESVFGEVLLKVLDIPHQKVNLYDPWQSKGDGVDLTSVPMPEFEPKGITYDHEFIHQFQAVPDTHKSSTGKYTLNLAFNIVPLQRLFMAKHVLSTGNDNPIYFGDEADVHQIFNVNGKMAFTHNFYQTQWFYNIVEQYAGVQLRSAVANFNQAEIVALLHLLGLPFQSCWQQRNGWCKQCDKCHRIFALSKSVGVEPPFEPTEKMLNNYKLGKSPDLGILEPNDVHKEVYAPFRTDKFLVRDPLIDVWEDSQLAKIEAVYGEYYYEYRESNRKLKQHTFNRIQQ